jgi:1,4-alpha-glucan branching enzyme
MKSLSMDAERTVQFELSTKPGSKVYVAGTFNHWNPTANLMKDNPDSGHFKASLQVPAGTHEYKFIVDGTWVMDPTCAYWTPNAYGSLNSVLHV